MKRKRTLIVVASLILGWYGFVVFLVPDLPGDRTPIFGIIPRSAFRSHFLSLCRGSERFGDPKAHTLQWVESARHLGNQYHLVFFRSETGEPEAIVAYPERSRMYKHGLIRRLALLDNETFTAPTHLIRRDGMICMDRASRFDASNIPTRDYLDYVNQPDNPARCQSLLDSLDCPADLAP